MSLLNNPSDQHDMLVAEMARLDALSTTTMQNFAAARHATPGPA